MRSFSLVCVLPAVGDRQLSTVMKIFVCFKHFCPFHVAVKLSFPLALHSLDRTTFVFLHTSMSIPKQGHGVS